MIIKRMSRFFSTIAIVLLLFGHTTPLVGTEWSELTLISQTMELVYVRAGSFLMGGTRRVSRSRPEEFPVHPVELTYDFWIGKYEVTFEQFDSFCSSVGREKPDDRTWGRLDRPVIHVSWWDAIAYCNWLSQMEDLPVAYRLRNEEDAGRLLDWQGSVTEDITTVIGYRLPTEAEWEYAARGGHLNTDDFLYAGSDDPDEVAWHSTNANFRTHSIGQKKENALGLFDMSGNVAEWCHDWWSASFYQGGERTNPIGPSMGEYRIRRGGSWAAVAETHCRVSSRSHDRPGGSSGAIGFRVARTAMDQEVTE